MLQIVSLYDVYVMPQNIKVMQAPYAPFNYQQATNKVILDTLWIARMPTETDRTTFLALYKPNIQ
jgi:hypothetical protein